MDAIEQARRYVAAIPGAVSGQGGHAATFSVACALTHGFHLSQGDAWSILCEYNRTCSPAWSEAELRHKLDSAMSSTKHKNQRGHLLSKRTAKFRFGAVEQSSEISRREQANTGGSRGAEPARHAPSKSKRYELTGGELPNPMADGTRALIKAAFEPGEWISICQAKTGDDGREVPKDGGLTLTREEWLRKLDERDGDMNRIMRTSDKNGIYVRLNPMKQGGSSDSHVAAFRHALVEFDNISPAEQWNLIQQSRIPCTAVISSGGKSLHAWVRVDAKDAREYADRVRMLYAHFDQQQRPDPKNKNPSRFSRLAGCMRASARQELLSLATGAESFSAWAANLETESIGQELSIDALLAFTPSDDPNCIIGQRYLCRGGSMMFVGQSGIGKSSLAVQAAVHWAVGRSIYGIAPKMALKSVFVQAENDDGDLAEMLQGVVKALNLTDDEKSLLRKNLIFISDATHTGDAFVDAAAKLIEKHRPDLFWGDPLLAFIGDDISKQVVIARFIRNGFGPIQKATGVTTIWVHHTNKPPTEQGKPGKNARPTNHSYAGAGSADLVNAVRAVCVLQRVDDEAFELKLEKRGRRAGATDLHGQPALTIWLRQAEVGIHWEQIDEPAKATQYSTNRSNKEGRPKAEFDWEGFMSSVGSCALIKARLIDRIVEYAGVSEATAKRWLKSKGDEFFAEKDGFFTPK